jgi:Protein of unknown function (DUF3579)
MDGTMQAVRCGHFAAAASCLPSPGQAHAAVPKPMTPPRPKQFLIKGQTHSGQVFRPSDWSERLAGAMSSFRPGGSAGGIGAFIGYSPYCVPQLVDGVKCVLVNEALKGIEPMAWDFVMNFARDNQLPVEEVVAALPASPAADTSKF